MQGQAPFLDRLRRAIEPVPSVTGDRRYRRLPPAITPLSPTDIAAGIVGHHRGTGREAFRAEIESFLRAESAASYTSFRRALCACLQEMAAESDGGSDVLVPAFCSPDFPEAIEGAGLDVRRYDVDPETLSADVASLEALPTEDALAVVAVNVLGYGSPMDRIEAYCQRQGVYLIEALGYALGTEYRGDRLGTYGDCSVVNFQQGKPIPVGGGMVVSQNTDLEFTDEGRPAVEANLGALAGYALFGRPRMYELYTQGKAVLERYTGSSGRHSTHPEAKFDVAYTPPFATISDFQGTIGRRTLDRLETHRRKRAKTAHIYRAELSECPHVRHLDPVEGLSTHQHVRYPLVVDSAERRETLQRTLAAAGVETSRLYDWPPIDGHRFPGAARLQEGILTLPTHPYVTASDCRGIVRTVREVLAAESRCENVDPDRL